MDGFIDLTDMETGKHPKVKLTQEKFLHIYNTKYIKYTIQYDTITVLIPYRNFN